ncbi:coagulation factor XI-like [Lepeophtheirus salmonis]|uniref:coagulation factor XI-like n=1 Tax=Lepeophtheirus salmonis TaxID=72036 RepID=UPI003AF3ECB5
MKLILTVVIAAFTFGFVECEFPCGKKLNACTEWIGETSIPWQAYTIRSYTTVKKSHEVTCNAIILNTNHVLSLQHCLYKYDSTDKISVHVGDGTKYSVKSVYVHDLDLDNVIPIKVAIAKIQGTMTFTKQMYAVCLPIPLLKLQRNYLYGTIWGKEKVNKRKGIYINFNKTSPECKNPILERPPRDDEKCLYRMDGKLDSNDHGTPFLMNHNYRCTLVGILSKGGESETPYMLDLVQIATWIQKILNL